MTKLLAALLAVAACGPGKPIPELNPDPANVSTKLIVGVAALMPDGWSNSPYARNTDLITSWPLYLALAADGTACIVSGEIMVMAHYGDRLHCAEGWRIPRPTH